MAEFTESELILPSLFLMTKSSGGHIRTGELKKKLFEILKPTGSDAETSKTRPNEPKFFQKVGNLKSHNTFDRESYAKYVDGGFEITERGKKHLKENYQSLKYFLVNDFNWNDIKPILKKIEVEKRKTKVFDENVIINEGIKKISESNLYTRSSLLRSFAIDHFKDELFCKCCSFDFEKFYGEIGHGFIEIHHMKPVFMFEGEELEQTLENALKNLIPVCSNCHRMIHRNWNKPLEIKSLINNIENNGVFLR